MPAGSVSVFDTLAGAIIETPGGGALVAIRLDPQRNHFQDDVQVWNPSTGETREFKVRATETATAIVLAEPATDPGYAIVVGDIGGGVQVFNMDTDLNPRRSRRDRTRRARPVRRRNNLGHPHNPAEVPLTQEVRSLALAGAVPAIQGDVTLAHERRKIAQRKAPGDPVPATAPPQSSSTWCAGSRFPVSSSLAGSRLPWPVVSRMATLVCVASRVLRSLVSGSVSASVMTSQRNMSEEACLHHSLSLTGHPLTGFASAGEA